MKLVHPSATLFIPYYDYALNMVGMASKMCYGKCLHENTDRSELEAYIKARLDAGHESIIEHIHISAFITTDRGVTHELVRHRLASYTQESTRFIDSAKSGITYIIPSWFTDVKAGEYKDPIRGYAAIYEWTHTMLTNERAYIALRTASSTPEQARAVLPNSFATKILITANLREWRHILALRAKGVTGRPHPQIQQVMYPIWLELHDRLPVFFEAPDKPLFDIQGAENVEVTVQCV